MTEDGSGPVQEEGRYPLPTSLEINYDIIEKNSSKYIFKSRYLPDPV